jgi:hypothetical protein
MWFLVILMAGEPNAAFDYYPSQAACRADLAPLVQHSLNNVACIYVQGGMQIEGCGEGGEGYCFSFVNGPSAGVWPMVLANYNERAPRGLWHHELIDLWRYNLAFDTTP